VDFAALFAALPTPYLVLTPDLVIAEANAAYLATVGRTRGELLGRPVFEAFPPTADALDESGVSRVQLSFERARDTGRPDTMAIQRYDILDAATGDLTQRFWSLISVPVLDAQGRTELLLQRVEDITDYVREQDRSRSDRERSVALQRRTEEAESDLYARARDLEAARAAESTATRRLAALADVTMTLAQAETVADLTDTINRRGLVALGAGGGAVAVAVGDGTLALTITSSLGERTQSVYAVLGEAEPLPACVAAVTGERVLLPDRRASLEWAPGMATVLADTGCEAWAALPLRSHGAVLGSLTVGWVRPHAFPAAEVELLDALAAQCAAGLERIQERQAERSAAAAAVRMSETLQRSLLTEPAQPAGLQVSVRYRPAAQEAQVGGDWYDAFLTPDGALCLVVGDVAGHDRDAAAVMGQVRNLLRGVTYTVEEPPAVVLATLDRALRDLDVGALATAVLAKVEQTREDAAAGLRTLRWSNAGHPPPLLIRPDGTTVLLTTPADLLLGLDAGSDRADHVARLEPGSTVLLYTDGLVERRGASLDDGLDWLVDTAGALAGLDLDGLCDALLGLVGADAEDDVALLALRALDAG